MSEKLNRKHPRFPLLKKSVQRSRPSSAKAIMQRHQQQHHNSPFSSDDDSSPTILRRPASGSFAVEETDGILGVKNSPKFSRWFGSESHDFHNPKNVQHLLSMLQQPGAEKVLQPNKDGDYPLHSIVRLQRTDKVELLVTLLTHSVVDINSRGKGGMTALHCAIQMYDITAVQVLLAFGANVNQVNLRNHTPLDIATILWLNKERHVRVNKGTNNLETVHESTICASLQSFPDVTSSPMLSPVPSPLLKRGGHKIVTRTDSSNSWIMVDQVATLPPADTVTSSSSEYSRESEVDSLQTSQDDSREFTRSVMPIKSADLDDEVPEEPTVSDMSANPIEHKPIEAILKLLYSVHAQSGKAVTHKFSKVSLLSSFCESDEFQQQLEAHKMKPNPFCDSNEVERSVKIKDYVEGRTLFTLYEELEFNINKMLKSQSSSSADDDIAIAMQQKEMYRFNKTSKEGLGFKVNGGSRLLFLDGGGIKGLVQIEVLRQLEEATGRKVTELFDWIIGSSIGAIVALGLVYAKKSLKELQQVFFKMKDDVFTKPRAGIAFNTKAMEKMIVDEFGCDMTMSDIQRPKVLIAAVNKKTSPPQLHFFNNCFQDSFSNAPVWKVARYTTAAPMFFTEFEEYVDGGVLANNPCDYGLTAIRNFHREKKVRLPISMVVSVGTGVYPPEEIGNTDAQEFLFFGKHWFNFNDTLKKRTQNLLSLLTNALVESEIVAKNCQTRCHEQDIPFYRFSPQLNHVVAAGEIENDKILDMMLQARIQTPQQGLSELVDLFKLVADASKKNKYRQSRSFAENV